MLRTSSDSAQRGRVPILVKPRDLSVFDNAHNARMDLEFLAALHFALGSVLLHKAAYERMNLDVLRSEEHTSELQSLMRISYAVFCLKKKTRLSIPCRLDNCQIS